jgi:hypothetical protein
MNTQNLSTIKCETIRHFEGSFSEQTVIVCDTETIRGKPYTIQFYDGIKTDLIYVTEHTIFETYCNYVKARMTKHLSCWFFYSPFDLPIIHFPFKDAFTHDSHKMGYGNFDFEYVSGKTWFGNHTYQGTRWNERDAFQYVFRGLEKVAKDLQLSVNKKPRPKYLGERKWNTETERIEFEEYAIADVLVLWELVYWILSLHRKYNVSLSVSLADLCGKIFRKDYVQSPIVPTSQEITLAALASYHGGKTESYVQGPMIIQNITEYDIVSAYPYAMTQIGNFFDYEVQPWNCKGDIYNNGVYQVRGHILCQYHPLYTETFERVCTLPPSWVTGWELNSALQHKCFDGEVIQGFNMYSHDGNKNGLAEYVWHFFKLKADAKIAHNITETQWAKVALNSLYGKFISKISDEVDLLESWHGGVLFHPLIATLITGFVRAYVHTIEHAGHSLHTSTDAIISHAKNLESLFPGVHGLGALKKEYTGDVLIIRPKVYIIFDKLDPHCYHRFMLMEHDKITCIYCRATVLKSATHGFFGSVQMLLNMWKGNQKNYIVKRMMRLKEAKKRKDPDCLPFVFSDQRRSLNVDWSTLSLWKG